MPITISIPLHTFASNERLDVPATSIPTGLTLAQFRIDRQVGAQSIDSTPTATINWFMEFSQDGGLTWGGGWGGGTIGGPLAGGGTFSAVGPDPFPGDPSNAQRMVRGFIQNGSVAISASGAINLS
jgi:hypothetical protein